MKQFVCALGFSLLALPISVQANVVGSDMQNFNPTTSGLDFVTVQSSETLEPGLINLGAFLNYAVNTLPYFEGSSSQNRINFNDSLLGMDLNIGAGIAKNWDVGLSFPQIVSQTVNGDDGPHGEFARSGITEIRANTKLRFFGDKDGGLATIASISTNTIENNPFMGKNPGPTFALELAADTTIHGIAVGGNIGHRFRNSGEALPSQGISPFKNQWIASTAASYHLISVNTKVIGEIYGSVPATRTNYDVDRRQSSLEALLGLKHDVNSHLALHFGGGTELIHGNASPDWRMYGGLNYTFGPLFAKNTQPVSQVVNIPQPPPKADKRAVIDFENDPFLATPKLGIETFVVKDILFEFDSDRLRASSQQTLDRLAAYLQKPPAFTKMVISGHTDSIGDAVYNLYLSQRRARSVRDYLMQGHGLPASRIEAKGYGEGLPIADNGNYQGRALNRRVEFQIFREASDPNVSISPKEIPTTNTTVIDEKSGVEVKSKPRTDSGLQLKLKPAAKKK